MYYQEISFDKIIAMLPLDCNMKWNKCTVGDNVGISNFNSHKCLTMNCYVIFGIFISLPIALK